MVSKGKRRHLISVYKWWRFKTIFDRTVPVREEAWDKFVNQTISPDAYSHPVTAGRLLANVCDVSKSTGSDDRLPMVTLFTEKGPVNNVTYL